MSEDKGIGKAIKTVVTTNPVHQRTIDRRREKLHIENAQDLVGIASTPMLYSVDPEYGEYSGSGAFQKTGTVVYQQAISEGFIPTVYRKFGATREPVTTSRGQYQKDMALYYNIAENRTSLCPMDENKFSFSSLNNNTKDSKFIDQNHFTEEMVYYMERLYYQVINKVSDTTKAGNKLVITSGFRDVMYNESIKDTHSNMAEYSGHSGGIAVDISVPNSYDDRILILDTAYLLGFGGLGLYSSFVHVDISGRSTWGGYTGPKGR